MHSYAERLVLPDVFLCVLALGQGAATLAIDLTKTHATNPEWPGHARFHVVWQSANTGLLTAIVAGVLGNQHLPEQARFHLALLITVVPMLGFIAALLFRQTYQGTLRDRFGVPPLVVTVKGERREIDMNTVAVCAGLLVAGALLVWHDWPR